MKRSWFMLFFGLALCFCAMTSAAQAQATRTWVSGTGDDVNPCSRTAPCKTFAGAISKTATGGEIDALDPGGYGTLTITKAITIDGGGGQVASVLASGVPGFTVNAGSGDRVSLRNLRIQGISSGTTGINFVAGLALIVENCVIQGFTGNGINFAPSVRGFLYVQDTTIDSSGGIGLVASTVASGGGFNRVELKNVSVVNSTGAGIQIGANTKAMIFASVSSRNGLNGVGEGIVITDNGEASIDYDLVSNNGGAGVHTANTAIARVGTSTINNNGGPGVIADGGTQLWTYQNNRMDSNGPGGGFTGNATPH